MLKPPKKTRLFQSVLLIDLMHFFFSSRRRHTRSTRDWSSDVCLPISLARAACHFDVRHEIELCRDHAFALALFAPAALDVEAESPRFVVALHRQRRLREQVADGVRSEERRVGKGCRGRWGRHGGKRKG